MKLYNTLTRRLEDLKPIETGRVSLYTCGPTVYDFAHIGNWRSFIFDDTLRRALESSGLKVDHVMNITDVGHLTSDADEGRDKLEAGAEAQGKSVWDVARRYIEVFERDAKALNILPPNGYHDYDGDYARATDFIEQQIEIVRLLLEKGFAYQTEQAIYFEVSKLPSYGELSGQKLEEKEVGARDEVVTDPNKRHPQDFALWFFTVGRFASHEMKWPSPWGEGFPGWHLECSAIIHATLGDPLDIHTGGVDHIGTHHTNEMAQTEAAYGHKLANIWMHNEFMLVDGRKMSKSAGNFITLEDVQAKGYRPASLRLLFLQAHYRSQMNFTWDSLSAAATRLKGYQAFADLRFQNAPENPLNSADLKQAKKSIEKAMSNDLATPTALRVLDSAVESANQRGVARDALKEFLAYLDDVLGLGLLSSEDINTDQKELIAQREASRAAKDWSKSDSLRKDLIRQGIEINDTPRGPIWNRA
jgi:cysteinyl-tRNA synthetase